MSREKEIPCSFSLSFLHILFLLLEWQGIKKGVEKKFAETKWLNIKWKIKRIKNLSFFSKWFKKWGPFTLKKLKNQENVPKKCIFLTKFKNLTVFQDKGSNKHCVKRSNWKQENFIKWNIILREEIKASVKKNLQNDLGKEF